MKLKKKKSVTQISVKSEFFVIDIELSKPGYSTAVLLYTLTAILFIYEKNLYRF